MKIAMTCAKPGEIEYTLTVTMKASEWEDLRAQTRASPFAASPLGPLTRAIDDLLSRARRVYHPDASKTDEWPIGLEPVAYTHSEGGPWIAFGTDSGPHLAAHAIKFSNGQVFDMVNGWRHITDVEK